MIVFWCPLCREEDSGAASIISATRNEDQCTDELVVTYTLKFECDYCDVIEFTVEMPQSRMADVFDQFDLSDDEMEAMLCKSG